MWCINILSPFGHEMHVPSINEIYLGFGPCLLNFGENLEVVHLGGKW